jgi:hypothetical protein
MALEDRVQTRISAARLVQLTNPDRPAATTLDSTRLAAAARDAEAELKAKTGITYDDTDAYHQAVGTDGVICVLQRRAGKYAEPECVQFSDALKNGFPSGTGARIIPQTNATTTPTADDDDATPEFDTPKMEPYTLDPR